MSAGHPQTTDPNSPTNDREFAVWEHGRIQGHREAARQEPALPVVLLVLVVLVLAWWVA